jgi:signal transduction histidine kinase
MRQALDSAFSWLQNLSIRKKLYLLVGIQVFNLVTVIFLSIQGMGILSQVRSYVAGEGLWAKAQKDAIYSLNKYVHSGREADYRDYLLHLEVPLGDREARLELSKPQPDLRVSDEGFLRGKNHPQDVRGMALLFLRFHRVGLIHRAIEIWSDADSSMMELQALSDGFHALSPRERAQSAVSAAFLQRLDGLNETLTLLENDFSSTMGEAARWAQRLLLWAMVLGSLGVGFLSVAIALYFSRSIVQGVTSISAAASRAAEGDFSAHVSLGTTDELGRLAEAFNAMTQSLARIDQLKNDFISTVSHELRTPLTLNLAPLESLLAGEQGPVPEPQQALLRVMDNNAQRLLQLVNGLLDFSKLQAGKMAVQREPLDIVRLTESVLADFRPAMQAKGLLLIAVLDQVQPMVMMDRYLYERILFNLLSNAVKFTPRGGRVTVELALSQGQLELRVTDTGIGISPDDAKRLFQKFSQAEASSTRRFEGTGLGLALVKECAQLLGGGASLRSQSGQGSTFSVHCLAPPAPSNSVLAPAPPRPRVPVELPSAPVAPPGASMLPRVIVAEDNPELAAFIAGLLAPICQVRLCADGEEAWEAAKAWEPDLVLSDVMMPRLDGVAMTQRLKTTAETASIPVILLTALTSQQDLLRGWDAGADDYLFKPFHPRELQARVRSLLAMVAWRRRSEQQRHRQEMLELFTRIASHDLKAPLRRMSSYAGLLEREAGAQLSTEAHSYLHVIAQEAAQMNAMIGSLIEFTRLDSDDAAFKACDLGEVLHNVRRLLQPLLDAEGAVLDVGPLPVIKAVPSQMFALFQNLIGNCLKYRSQERPPRIQVRCERQGQAWSLFVQDNGIGFDPAHKEAVFALFKRLNVKEGVPGEGMGLAIARKIVDLHGGRIWAEPSPGQGCTMAFTLPGSQASLAPAPERAAA